LAKISTYVIDGTIVDGDKVIGSDANNDLQTKNYKIGDLVNYFAASIGNNLLVPYVGATNDVDLGTYGLFVGSIDISGTFTSNGSVGLPGEVLMSQGPGLPAVWAYNIGSQDLQNVLLVGNTADRNINLVGASNSIILDVQHLLGRTSIYLHDSLITNSSYWKVDSLHLESSTGYAVDYLTDKIRFTNAGNFVDIKAASYSNQSFSFPTNGGFIPMSVNGVYADGSGSITIPIGLGTVTAVTASLPLSSSGGVTPNLSISQASALGDGYLSSANWNAFNAKQDQITLTTTGTSGTATFIGNVLNVPDYSGAIGTTPNLQQVTDVVPDGNKTTNPIIIGYTTNNTNIDITGVQITSQPSSIGDAGFLLTAYNREYIYYKYTDNYGSGIFGETYIRPLIDGTYNHTNNIYFPDASGTLLLDAPADGSTYARKDNVWEVIGSGVTPTLQQVLDFNHDLLNGNNFQGTGAGIGNTGNYVIALGTNAAQSNGGGNYVVAIGNASLVSNIGSDVVGIGNTPLFFNSGNSVVGIGSGAGQYNSGTSVVLIGSNAGLSNISSYFVAIGDSAGSNDSSPSNSVSIGNQAGQYNSGGGSIIIGGSAGSNNSGGGSILLGNGAGQGNSGINFISIGENSGTSNTGNYSIAIGAAALLGNTSDNTIAIGYNAGSFGNANDTYLFGNNAYPTAANQIVYTKDSGVLQTRFQLTSTADRLINIPDADGTLALSVNGNFADATGNITISAGGGTNPTSTYIPYNNAGTFADSYLINDTASSVLKTNYSGTDKGIYLDFASNEYYLGDTNYYVKVDTSIPETTISTLSGTGTEMVVADASGVLSRQAIPSGTVTAVTATSPITSSGGTAPDISTSMNTNKLIGRSTAGVGVMEEITVGSGLTLTGAGILNNTATPTPLGYYGAFSDVTDQFATVINTGYPMLLGVTDLSNQVTVVSGSRITIANTGIYNIQWSAQFRNPTASEHDVTIWLRKNGVDVPGSAGVVLVPKKHGSFDGHTLPSWNFLLDVVAGDYYEFVWSTQDLSVFISFEPAGNPPPSTASVVLTVTQQAGIMAGTGITAINSLTGAAQTIVAGTSGTDFAVSSTGTTHTLNLPTASVSNRGALSTADWTTFNNKIGGSGTTGAIPKFSASTTLTDAVADTDYMQQSDVITGYQLMGSTIKGSNLAIGNPMQMSIASLVLTSGRSEITAIFIQKTTTITGVKWYQVTNGSYTANNYNGVGLYSQSGGNLTLVASCANDGTIWQPGSAGWKNKAFSSTYTASRGVYYLAALYSSSAQTTAPGIGGTVAGAGAWATLSTVDFSNNERVYAGINTQTSLVTPIALSTFGTGNSTRFGFYLY